MRIIEEQIEAKLQRVVHSACSGFLINFIRDFYLLNYLSVFTSSGNKFGLLSGNVAISPR